MADRTTNFAFELIEFDKIPWHTKEQDNWRSLDAVLSRFISILNFKGTWQNATAVVQGDRYVDPDLFTIWEVETSHTTPSTGTFLADRTASPTRWSSFTTEFANGGAYTVGTEYGVNTFLVDSNRYGVALGTFTAATSYDTDVAAGNILTLIDLSTDLAAASASAAASAVSAAASAASAASTNLPASITASTYLKANATATGYVSITSAAVRTDIGAAASGANTDITSATGITEINSLTTALTVAQGGTNSTTATGAQTVLGVRPGTDVEVFDAATAKTDEVNVWSAAQQPTVTALTTATADATIAITMGTSNDFSLTMTENATLSNPADTVIPGQKGTLFITNGATGAFTLAFGTEYDFVGGEATVITATVSARDSIDYRVRADGQIELGAALNYS